MYIQHTGKVEGAGFTLVWLSLFPEILAIVREC